MHATKTTFFLEGKKIAIKTPAVVHKTPGNKKQNAAFAAAPVREKGKGRGRGGRLLAQLEAPGRAAGEVLAESNS